ncbi:ABC transporter permease [Streptomyces sp. NPDC048518]|uniref:ABC transporter permease n=1 Tax=Streptomyces sp. NPDC048518 TaxID=3155029 RepID=UPI0033FDF111
MKRVLFASLRRRWSSLLGAFVAVVLGVGLVTAMGLGLDASLSAPDRAPVRFAGSPVVVMGQDRITVRVERGPATGLVSKPLAHPQPVDIELLRELRRLGPVRLDGAARDAVGVDAPAREVREVVGDRALVLTGGERRRADPGTARDAAALVAVNSFLGTAGGVAAFVSVFVTASTFGFVVALRRREFGLLRMAGATPGQVRRLLLGEALAVGVLASAAGCVLGAWGGPLLARQLVEAGIAPSWFRVPARLPGALPGTAWLTQPLGLSSASSAPSASSASSVSSVSSGSPGSSGSSGASPSWPFHLAFWTGLVVAVSGAWVAARRAGRIAPAEAMRDASVDSGVLPLGRRIAGAVLLACGIGLLVRALGTDPSALLKRKTYTTQPMILISAAAALAPLLVPPVARAFRLPGALGRLVRANSAASVRRTAAVAAPVLVTVALAGSLLGSAQTVGGAKAAEAKEQLRADLVVTGERLRRVGVRDVPGAAAVSPSSSTAVFVREGGSALVRSEARAVSDPAALAATTRLPVVAGDVRDLDDRSIVVNEEWERHEVGERVAVRLGDGRPAELRIAAVLARGTGDNGAYVTAANARAATVDRIDVRLKRSPAADGAQPSAATGTHGASAATGARGASAATGAHGVTAASTIPTAHGVTAESTIPGAHGATAASNAPAAPTAPTASALSTASAALAARSGGEVRTADAWLAATHPRIKPQTRLGLLMILGICLVYAGISLASTLLMATPVRRTELRSLRLAGATRGQVRLVVAGEALAAVAVGTLLGLAVTALNLGGLSAGLSRLSAPAAVTVPWDALGVSVGVCALVAVAAAVTGTAGLLRVAGGGRQD